MSSFYHLDRESAPQAFSSAELNEESEAFDYDRLWQQLYWRRGRVVDMVRASIKANESFSDNFWCVY
jgi:hypothetical protein